MYRSPWAFLEGKTLQIAVAMPPTRTLPLEMPGSTALDPARLIRMRVRFAPADVVAMGQIVDPHGSPATCRRPAAICRWAIRCTRAIC